MPATAGDLDSAKDMVDRYYMHSQERNVEGYINLFDKEYLNELYGPDHEEFLSEVLSYYDIIEYELGFQYYTEGDDSLSLFYNLKTRINVEGKEIKQDNDLVAFFSNDAKLKLKYIILQETFIEQMNREVIYKSAIESFVDEESDLLKEAESNDLKIDYEDMIDHKDRSFNSIMLIGFIIMGLLALYAFIVYRKDDGSAHKKHQNQIKHLPSSIVKDSRSKLKRVVNSKSAQDLSQKSKELYKKAVPILKENGKNAFTKSSELAKNGFNQSKRISKEIHNEIKKIIAKR